MVVIGFGIGVYVVSIGGIVVGLIARIILGALRYIFYNIYTLLITVVIVLGIVFTPQIENMIDGFSDNSVKIENTTPAIETTTTYYCKAKSNLNIRKQPSSNATVLGVLKPGQSVEVYRIEGDWATIKYKDSKAYVSSRFISLTR